MKCLQFIIPILIIIGCNAAHNQRAEGEAIINPGLSGREWIEDIDYTIHTIDSLHPSPYQLIDREELLERYDALKRMVWLWPDNRIVVELHRLIASLQDGHTRFLGAALSAEWYPVRVEMFSDGVYITAVDIRYKDLIGSKLLSVGNTPADSVFARILEIVPGDNINGKRYFAPAYFMMRSVMSGLNLTDRDGSLVIKVEKAGTKSNAEIWPDEFQTADDLSWFWRDYGVPSYDYINIIQPDIALPLCLRNYNIPFWFEYLEESGTVYLGFNQCTGDGFPEFSSNLWRFIDSSRAANLIIDLRNNFGGTNTYLETFVDELIKRTNINSEGHLFVITGNKTFSAAMHFATWLEQRSNAIFVGQPTGARPNHFADADFSYLPNSRLLLMVSKQYWENGGPGDDRLALEPDWIVSISSGDYFDYRDPVMDRILDYLSQQ